MHANKKIHKQVNGRLLQINKTWKNLRASQKEFISNALRECYIDALKEQRKPSNDTCEQILNQVFELIEERDIWIPRKEVLTYFNGKKERWEAQYRHQVQWNKD